MKVGLLRVVFFICCSVYLNVLGQDIHFSQFNSSPLNLNPATTGFFDGTHRFIVNHRSQWRSVTVPFSTISASFDMKLLTRKFSQDMFGFGLVINRDVAGDSKFGTTQANFSLSYVQPLNNHGNHFISIALQMGMAQRSINYAELMFDNQWMNGSYNPSNPTGESFIKENFTFYDLSTGLHWEFHPSKTVNYNGGVSFFHLNNPPQSLFNDASIILDNKYLIYGNSRFPLRGSTEMIPGFLLMNQGPYYEITVGSKFRFIKENNFKFYRAISFGIFSRAVDAAILILGYDYQMFNFGISYDVNYSNLIPASNLRGGYEISIIYRANKIKNPRPRVVPCPVF